MIFIYRISIFFIIPILIYACSSTIYQTSTAGDGLSFNLEPIIQLGHSDEVTNAFFVPNSNCIISSSLDGSIKIWELDLGRELKTLKDSKIQKLVWSQNRREHEPNITDKIYSLAVSPNGKYIISGGVFGHLNIWDVSTGEKYKTVKSIWRNELISTIAFSNNGEKFITGSEDGKIQIWDFSHRSIAKGHEKHSSRVNSIAIDPNDQFILSGSSDGSLILWDEYSDKIRILQEGISEIRTVSISSDGKFALSGDSDFGLKLWTIPTGNEIRNFKGQYGKVNSVSFSPDNRYFASGHANSVVIIWDILTGEPVKSFSVESAAVNSVQYSNDGKYVLAGCSDGTLLMWRIQNSALVALFQGNSNTPSPISISNDNRFLLSGINNNSLDLWDIIEGRLIRSYKWQPKESLSQIHRRINSVGFSSDNLFVTSLNSNGGRKTWNIYTGKEEEIPINKFSLKFQTVDHLSDGHYLSSTGGARWVNMYYPHRRGTSTLGTHITGVSAVRFSADGEFALSGEQAGLIKIWEPFSIRKKVGELRGHLDVISSISLTNDNRFVGSSSKDNTVRIWDRINQKEIAKLISSPNGEWIIATPDGYYNTSPEGSNLIHWSAIQSKEAYTFERFESLFRKPEIIKARLSGNLNAGKPAPEITLPPKVEIVDNSYIKETGSKTQEILIRTSSTRIVKSVRIFLNGKPLQTINIDSNYREIAIDVPLLREANRITAISYDDRGFSSNPEYIDVICKDPSISKPNLYVLGIGISTYPFLSAKSQLEFADTDAESLISTLASQEGKYFAKVEHDLILNEMATSENIIAALDSLRYMSENDIAIILMAGHGVKDNDGHFYFLGAKGNFDDPQQDGIDWSLITSYISEVKGRVILFIDACHSGSIVTETIVPNDELAQEFFSGKRGGVMVFSASKGRQFSFESPDIGNGAGVFTHAITQGLVSKSNIVDINGNGFVEFLELVDYVTEYVNKVTDGLQTPWLSRRELFGDLPIGIVSN